MATGSAWMLSLNLAAPRPSLGQWKVSARALLRFVLGHVLDAVQINTDRWRKSAVSGDMARPGSE
jgi:hypothetical protein